MTHPDTTALRDRIAGLDDEHAITTLAHVLARLGYQPNPFSQTQHDQHLRDALTQPDITTTITLPASDGDLARTALTHLATTDPAGAALIDHALNIAPSAERDPTLLLGVGALVLFAFRADIDLTRDPRKGWSFHFHTTGLSDTAIGKLLGQLLGNYLNPGE